MFETARRLLLERLLIRPSSCLFSFAFSFWLSTTTTSLLLSTSCNFYFSTTLDFEVHLEPVLPFELLRELLFFSCYDIDIADEFKTACCHIRSFKFLLLHVLPPPVSFKILQKLLHKRLLITARRASRVTA